MSFLKWVRYAAWTAVVVAAFGSAALLLGWWRVDGSRLASRIQAANTAPVDIGGPFSLTNQRGESVTEKEFLGRPMAVFFGFTHCPEVCPTTLVQLGNLTKEIGQAADKLQILFITVDPERDTPQQMALYLESFDPRVVGLSGTREQVEAALKSYKAFAKKVPTDGSYTMDHTASVYLMNADGSFRTMIDYHEEDSSALAKIRMVLK
jgi:protein SCO1/2